MNDETDWTSESEAAQDRDPRTAPYGYYSKQDFELDDSRLFVWFESLEALARHILEVEPRGYEVPDEPELDDDDEPVGPSELEQYQARLAPVLEGVRVEGLTETLRLEMNEIIKGVFVIEWWGQFNELASGGTEFGRSMRDMFRDQGESGADATPISHDEIEDFVEFLRTAGV